MKFCAPNHYSGFYDLLLLLPALNFIKMELAMATCLTSFLLSITSVQFVHAVVCAIRCFWFLLLFTLLPPFSWVYPFLWDGLLGSGWLGNVAVSARGMGKRLWCLQISEQIPAVLKLWSTFLVWNYGLFHKKQCNRWTAPNQTVTKSECLMSQLSWSMSPSTPLLAKMDGGWI